MLDILHGIFGWDLAFLVLAWAFIIKESYFFVSCSFLSYYLKRLSIKCQTVCGI